MLPTTALMVDWWCSLGVPCGAIGAWLGWAQPRWGKCVAVGAGRDTICVLSVAWASSQHGGWVLGVTVSKDSRWKPLCLVSHVDFHHSPRPSQVHREGCRTPLWKGGVSASPQGSVWLGCTVQHHFRPGLGLPFRKAALCSAFERQGLLAWMGYHLLLLSTGSSTRSVRLSRNVVGLPSLPHPDCVYPGHREPTPRPSSSSTSPGGGPGLWRRK